MTKYKVPAYLADLPDYAGPLVVTHKVIGLPAWKKAIKNWDKNMSQGQKRFQCLRNKIIDLEAGQTVTSGTKFCS